MSTETEYQEHVREARRRWAEAGLPSFTLSVPAPGEYARGARAPEPPAPAAPVVQVGVVSREADLGEG